MCIDLELNLYVETQREYQFYTEKQEIIDQYEHSRKHISYFFLSSFYSLPMSWR